MSLEIYPRSVDSMKDLMGVVVVHFFDIKLFRNIFLSSFVDFDGKISMLLGSLSFF